MGRTTYGTVQQQPIGETDDVKRERKIVYALAVTAMVFGVVGITVQAQNAQR